MTNRRFKAVDSLWLALAFLLHSAFLLVPMKKSQKLSRTQESITVILDIQAKAVPNLDQLVPYQPSHNQESEIQQSAPPLPQDVRQLKPKQLSTPNSSTPITTAQLLLNVSELKFPPQESDKKRQLGTFEPLPLPANWLPRPKLEDNLFNSRMVSSHTKIVDQWKSTDGAYNVIVKTATGKTLCGQAQSWSSMNPLEEPIFMWRSCD